MWAPLLLAGGDACGSVADDAFDDSAEVSDGDMAAAWSACGKTVGSGWEWGGRADGDGGGWAGTERAGRAGMRLCGGGGRRDAACCDYASSPRAVRTRAGLPVRAIAESCVLRPT